MFFLHAHGHGQPPWWAKPAVSEAMMSFLLLLWATFNPMIGWQYIKMPLHQFLTSFSFIYSPLPSFSCQCARPRKAYWGDQWRCQFDSEEGHELLLPQPCSNLHQAWGQKVPKKRIMWTNSHFLIITDWWWWLIVWNTSYEGNFEFSDIIPQLPCFHVSC